MTSWRQAWLVARREMRERSRTGSFRAGLVAMLLIVIAMVVVPSLIDPTGGTKAVGLTGATPSQLSQAVRDQGDSVGTTIRTSRHDTVAAGREAIREGDIDVLVVDGRRLEWQGRADEQLQAVVTGAIQLVSVQQRAAATGVDPDDLMALLAPVSVEKVEIGLTAGRGPDDGTAAIAMTVLLLMAVFLYGNLVLTGVVEEKASRVVEVLLARMSPRNLLVGKVAGIGLLGFAQLVVTAAAALVATMVVDSVDIPAVSADVLAWMVLWFILGYALYAVLYGAFGSLASRTEDAQSVAGPVGYLLVASYWASFIAVSGDPDSGWSRLLSLIPATAPWAMPGRIALGAAAWWEPLVAVTLTAAAVVGLVLFAGRVYTNAILRTGPTLRLREAWRSQAFRTTADPAPERGGSQGESDGRCPPSGSAAVERDRHRERSLEAADAVDHR